MTKHFSTKKALFASLLSLVLCVSMLVGTTFAWFTDVAESKGNKIQAGTLQVELWEGETNISLSETPIFNHTKWEPGYSDFTDLTVKNVGTLALKYQLVFQNITTTGDADLTEVLDVFVGNDKVGTLKSCGETYVLASGTLEATQEIALDRITVQMQTTAGNKYQGCGVEFDVQLRAIQWNKELDGFENPDYDINADGTPDNPNFNNTITGVETNVTIPADHEEGADFTYTNGDETIKVTVPGAAAGEVYKVNVAPTQETDGVTVDTNQGSLSFDISVLDSEDQAAAAKFELAVPANMPNVKLFHAGVEMTAAASAAEVDAAEEYYYDAENGIITMYVENYSNFTVRYEYTAEIAGKTYGTIQEAINDAAAGATIKLLADTYEAVVIDKALTLNLNGKTLTGNGSDGVIQALAGATVTIMGDGKVVAEEAEDHYAMAIWAKGGDVIVNNGDFSQIITGNDATYDLLYAGSGSNAGGSITINGGTFNAVTPDWTLNRNDTNGEIIVMGGSFNGYDPSSSISENPVANFVAIGYKVTEKDGVYTVSQADFFLNADGKYEIRTGDGLMEFAASVNSGNNYAGKEVILGCNVDLGNRKWEPIGQTIAINGNEKAYNFLGSFDGQNNTIFNLNVAADGQTNDLYASGLFGFLDSDATIKNIKIDGANIKGHHWVGAVCGYIAKGNIENCHVINATIVNTHINSEACGDKTGVIVGYTTAKITNCSAKDSTVTVDGRDAGQIAGMANPTLLEKCTAENVTVKAVAAEGANCDKLGNHVKNALIGREG